MKISLIHVAFVVLFLTLCSGAYPDSRVEGEQIKQQILSWLDSMHSLQCTYTLRIEGPAFGYQESEVKFLWQGQNFYYESILLAVDPAKERERPQRIGSVLTESLVNGKSALLGFQNGRHTGEVNRSEFLNDAPTRQMWKLFHTQSKEEAIRTATPWLGLRTILSMPGFATLIEREGEKILAYWTTLEKETSCGLNLHLDAENRIIQADIVDRPGYCTFEEAQRYVTGDIYCLVKIGSSLFLMDYMLFGEVWFPSHIREEVPCVTEESHKRFRDQMKSIVINDGPCKYYVSVFEGYEYDPYRAITYDLRIDPGKITFNKKLRESDFEIDFPPGTDLVNKEIHEVFTTAQETWLERHADLLIILVALGILGGVTIAGWRYWLGKP